MDDEKEVLLYDGLDVPDELDIMRLFPAELYDEFDDTLVLFEWVGVGSGLGMPGPRGGYSKLGAVSARRRVVNGRSADEMAGREGDEVTDGCDCTPSGNDDSVGVWNPFEVEPHGDSESGVWERMRGEEGMYGDVGAAGCCVVHENGFARTVAGEMRSDGSSTNLVVCASAISSISSNDGIEIIGRSVSIEDIPLGMLMKVGWVMFAYGFDSASNSRRRGWFRELWVAAEESS